MILFVLLSLIAGGAVVGLLDLRLRLEERILLGMVFGIALPTTATYLISLLLGFGVVAILLGPVIVLLAALLCVALGAAVPLTAWAVSWREAAVRWRRHPRIGFVVFGVVVAVFFGVLFGRALTQDGAGNLVAGYPAVWADWAQHLTTASSFAVAGNFPPVNPLFSGTPLLYPFMPDFHSAELMVLGAGPGVALAVPGAVLAVVVALLLVCLAERLGSHPAVGGIAAAMTFLGGGLGFVGILKDIGPGKNIAGVVLNQPRAYDGLPPGDPSLAFHNLQWPTPLMGWWLPQRGFLYAFAMVVAVLLVLVVALHGQRRRFLVWGVAGVVAGLLPLYHVHSFIALAVILLALLVFRRRREWIVFGVTTMMVAAPRLMQLSLAPHGDTQDNNIYPSVAVGWRYHFDPSQLGQGLDSVFSVSPAGIIEAIGHSLVLPFHLDWWGFWIVNLGIALPLSAFVVIAVIARYIPGRLGSVALRLLEPFPRQLLPLTLGCILIFAMANVVVFQSWDWDNTKLFAYWYLGVGLLTGCVVVHLCRRWWGVALSVVLLTSVLGSGMLGLIRLSPWEASTSRSQVAGPFVLDSVADIELAREVAARTPGTAVFVTSQSPQDPILTLAGRTTVMGYYGWLWSYGTVLGTRPSDTATVLQGCGRLTLADPGCPIAGILHAYGVDYVETDLRAGRNNGVAVIDSDWWARQSLPVVARSDDIVVYDVRQP